MERGTEGFFIVNIAADKYDTEALDVTMTNLEGCYRELRNQFTVAIQNKEQGKKYITRWGTWPHGGVNITDAAPYMSSGGLGSMPCFAADARHPGGDEGCPTKEDQEENQPANRDQHPTPPWHAALRCAKSEFGACLPRGVRVPDL